MRHPFLLLAMVTPLLSTSCLVHHRRHHHPPPAASVTVSTPPPVRTPPPAAAPREREPEPQAPSHARVRAPAASDHPAPHHTAPIQPALDVRVTPQQVRPGQEVRLHLTPARQPVIVFFNGRPLPKKTAPSGKVLTVTIPAGAVSDHFEVEWQGQRFRTEHVRVEGAPSTPPPPPPALRVKVTPPQARPGQEVRLHLTPPRTPVIVYFNGRPLPKKTAADGRILIVTVPAGAVSGQFEVEWQGQRFGSEPITVQP